MASSNPPRKFAPAPIEQTTKSSRQPALPKDDQKKPRRFAPEPIEETVKSSKDARQPAEPNEKPKPRRFAPQPVETSVKSSKDVAQKSNEPAEKPKPRRFAPQPVETTTKSSKDVSQPSIAQDQPKPRRFAPQIVEQTHKSSHDKEAHEKKGHVHFKPEIVSTTVSSSRTAKKSTDGDDDATEKKPPRRFTPIFLESATRSRKAGEPNAPLSQSDRTEYAYHLHAKEHWKRVTGVPSSGPSSINDGEADPADAMDIDDEDSDGGSEGTSSSQGRRQVCIDGSAPSQRPSLLMPLRQHSFRAPELDTIDSSESEPDSNPSPMSTSPILGSSPIAVPDYEFFKHATRIRESIDENFTQYLLEVERRKQQQRLEEQALAAFPNADFGYEPPDHYINNDDDSDDMEIEDRPVTFDLSEEDYVPPRDNAAREMSWEQQEAQKAAEVAQQERNANKVTHKTTQSPFWRAPNLGDDQQDPEVKAMRDRARPPMLGADLVFPRCTSPEPARFDVTQGSAALRNQMCYLSEVAEAERKRTGEDGGLWQVKAENKRINTIKSGAAATPKKSTHKGLWGGFCAADENSPMKAAGMWSAAGPTGLQTPKNERADPMALMFVEGRNPALKTPEMRPTGMKEADLNHLDAVLVTENDLDDMMDREFPDSFITQVYNYLSLGYPSLAKPFDEELSKISRIPISELRQDDRKAKLEPRGYIRLGPDFEGGGGEGMTEESCVRWQALKLYVREWASQEKNMVKTDGIEGNWGTGARRGSWAI